MPLYYVIDNLIKYIFIYLNLNLIIYKYKEKIKFIKYK